MRPVAFVSCAASRFRAPPPLSLSPATAKKHAALADALGDPQKQLIVSQGPAGCGKTHAACEWAARLLMEDDKRVVRLMRPSVAVEGEEHGFLPGELEDKLAPWMAPMLDHLDTMLTPTIVRGMIKRGRIRLEPFSHLRGRNFDACFVIADEMQNSTPLQMLSLLTRIGSDSRVYVAGDVMQSDVASGGDGLTDLLRRMEAMDPALTHVTAFDEGDVMRSELVRQVLRAYSAKNPSTGPL